MIEPSDTDCFRFSESVETFYRDKRVRSAVELLVDGDRVAYAPDSVDWDEVETFYDACLSARQTQIEHAKDLFRLWMAVWADIPAGWVAVPADPGDDELSLDPVVRWSEGYFERHFKIQNGKVVTMWVSLGDDDKELDEAEIAFDVKAGEKHLIKRRSAEIQAGLPSWNFKMERCGLCILTATRVVTIFPCFELQPPTRSHTSPAKIGEDYG